MSDPTPKGKFLTLPLCWLAADLDWKTKLNDAVDFGVVYYLTREGKPRATLRKSSEASEREARNVIGFTGGCLDRMFEGHDRVRRFTDEFISEHGPTFNLRLSTPLLFESRDDEGLTERELRVHMAITSVLGSKGYARVGWVPIQYRAAGYLRKPPEGVALYSRSQIERSIKELVARGLWRVYSYASKGKKNPGARYWSNRLSLEELVTAVTKSKARQSALAVMQRQAAAIAAKLENTNAY